METRLNGSFGNGKGKLACLRTSIMFTICQRRQPPFDHVDATMTRDDRRYVSIEDPVLARHALIRYKVKT